MNQPSGRRHFNIDMSRDKGTRSWFNVARSQGSAGEGTNRGAMFLAVFITLAVLALLVWYVFARITAPDVVTEVPLIEAPATPVKIEPEDRGGLEVPDQDKLVFDRVSGTERNAEERVTDSAEEPIELPVSRPQQVDVQPEPPEPADMPAPAAGTPSRASPAPVPAESGFAVQLGAFGSRAAAETAWRRAEARYTVLAGLAYDLEPLSRSTGTLYRLRVGSFDSRAAADRICQSLKAAGQDCLVAAR